MTQYEMTEKIAEKCNVTLEEAKAALENGEWNMLTAAQALEQEKVQRMQELDAVATSCATMTAEATPEETAVEAQAETDAQAAACDKADEAADKASKRCRGKGFRNLGEHIKRLVACGNRNRFEVRRGDAMVLEMPVTALAVLMLVAFWACLLLLGIGLFTGCRYSFSGKELDRASLNGALEKAAETAEHVKQSVAHA